jgi:hypothetical protein
MTIPRDGLELIGRAATGSLRDGINLLEQICDSYGKDASLDAVREGLGLVADERATDLAQAAIRGDLTLSLQIVNAVRDDGRNLVQFQKEVVSRLRELLLVQSGAEAGGVFTPEQVAEMRESVEGVSREKVVQVLKLLSLADLRQDPLSPLPLEIALAESTIEPAMSAPRPAEAAPRPAPRAAAPTSAPAFSNRPSNGAPARPAAQRPASGAPKPADSVPADLRKDNITGASAEDIARMVGSKANVIPPASDAPDDVPPVPGDAPADGRPANGAPASNDMATFVDARLRPALTSVNAKLAAFLNGECHAVSFEDGVLTLGFYKEGFHKQKAEESANKRQYEEVASGLLGAPVTLRCIIVEKPGKKASKSALVQHAVQNHGAQIVSDE